jgi:multidrug resistance protein
MRPSRTATLVLTSAASFMVAFDAMVVATALVPMRTELQTSIERLQWTVNAYNIAFALLLLAGAALGDRYGRRRLLMLGLALFVGSSVGCALARDVDTLIAARALQGAGAAFVMPLAMALLGAAFPKEQRAKALGMFSGITGLALILGPTLGGAIAEGLHWRWVFWINLPVGLVVMPLLRLRVAESRGAGPAGLQAFASMFRLRAFASAIAASFLFYAPMYATLFFLPQCLQAMGADPRSAGLQLLPWTATLFVTAPLAGRWVQRFGERAMVVSGVLLQAAGLLALGLLASPGAPYARLIPALLVAGVGVSSAMPAAQNAVLGAVGHAQLGQASGVFNVFRYLGGAFGVALLGVVFERFGSVPSAAAFSAGFAPAMTVAAALSVLAAFAALGLPGRRWPVPLPVN